MIKIPKIIRIIFIFLEKNGRAYWRFDISMQSPCFRAVPAGRLWIANEWHPPGNEGSNLMHKFCGTSKHLPFGEPKKKLSGMMNWTTPCSGKIWHPNWKVQVSETLRFGTQQISVWVDVSPLNQPEKFLQECFFGEILVLSQACIFFPNKNPCIVSTPLCNKKRQKHWRILFFFRYFASCLSPWLIGG